MRACRWLGPLLLSLALVGCDPAYRKAFPIHESSATARIEQVLAEFDTTQLHGGLVRSQPSPEVVAHFREQGLRILRWYDRVSPVTFERGSYDYLAVVVDVPTSQVQLLSVAFPAITESPDVRVVRERLSSRLCESGFAVSGSCG